MFCKLYYSLFAYFKLQTAMLTRRSGPTAQPGQDESLAALGAAEVHQQVPLDETAQAANEKPERQSDYEHLIEHGMFLHSEGDKDRRKHDEYYDAAAEEPPVHPPQLGISPR
jgi:hypothetical protein